MPNGHRGEHLWAVSYRGNPPHFGKGVIEVWAKDLEQAIEVAKGAFPVAEILSASRSRSP